MTFLLIKVVLKTLPQKTDMDQIFPLIEVVAPLLSYAGFHMGYAFPSSVGAYPVPTSQMTFLLSSSTLKASDTELVIGSAPIGSSGKQGCKKTAIKQCCIPAAELQDHVLVLISRFTLCCSLHISWVSYFTLPWHHVVSSS